MALLDIKEFEDLLSSQAERSRQFEETASPPPPKQTLQKYLEQKSNEELKRATEKHYKKEDLPEDYFFSALGEIVLSDGWASL